MQTSIINSLQQLYVKKLTGIYDGNISAKTRGSNTFYITPGGVRKHTIRDNDLVSVRISDLSYDGTPSRELPMHAHFMKYTDNEFYCIHCHPPHIIAYTGLTTNTYKEFSTIKSLFPELNYDIVKNVPFFPAGSTELADAVFDNLKDSCQNNTSSIAVMQNHGVMATGSDINYLLDMIETLDFYSNISLKAA